ncbi:hypothetical protein [Paenibacillus sp. MMS20-IR301]|uniref:hypothetical protein n=1 Tax=Paenibacillus sp. MMS20-IR301 TaxID=2895946 RepID=UPI0028E6648E|nr:hypothetical protein [Paenibacillus sp. MMS20-IR301]WNS46602.1 hypothetical protein LOS79_15510 [Paenibacillus sp. MMS20-IR301]
MHKRRKAFVLLLLSTFAASQLAGITGTTAYAATASTSAAAVTEISTLNSLSSIKLGTALSVKLGEVGIFSQTGGNILTYTLTYTNNSSSSVNLVNYFSKVATASGSLIKGTAISADSSVKKIAAKQSTSITYYVNIGSVSSAKGLKINMYGWNFSAANYEQRIGTFTVPANYSLSALTGETKKVQLSGIPVNTKAESVQIYKYNGKAYAKVGVSLTNLGTKVLTDPGYSLYLKSSGGSTFTLTLDDSSSEYKVQPQEKKTLYYMTEIPVYMNVTKMTLQVAKLDEGLKLYLPVAMYALPAAGTANFTVAAGYTKKVSIDSNIIDMQLMKAGVHADNGNGVWSYQFRVKNTGSKAVTLPAYELAVKSAEGYTFPVTTTAFNSLTLKPLEEKLIELTASVPLELNQDTLELQMVAPAASSSNGSGDSNSSSTTKVILPVAYFKIPYSLESNTHIATENSITNSYGTFGVTLNSLQRLPWGSEDLVQAKVSISNHSSKTITLPALTGVIKVDQSDLSASSQLYNENTSTVLAPGGSTQLTVLARVPYSLNFSQAQIILQEASGTGTVQFLSLGTTDGFSSGITPLAAGESFKITSTGKQASVKERSTTVYSGTSNNLIYSEVEMSSEETRQSDLSRLDGQFKTADGQYFEATTVQSDASTSPAGKTLVTFWANIPAGVDTSGLQLYVSQEIAGGKLTTAGTAATAYVNTSALTLTPAIPEPASNLTSVSLYPYTLAVSNSTGTITAGTTSLAIAFNYNLTRDTTYQMGAFDHKLVLHITDPYGQYFEKTLSLGTDLMVGNYSSYTTTITNTLFKNLSGGTYKLTLYDEFQGQRTELGGQVYSIDVVTKATSTTDTAASAGTGTGTGSTSESGS